MHGVRNHGGRPLVAATKCKNSPEENQDAGRNNDFFSGSKSHEIRRVQQHPVHKDIVPLPHEIQSWRLALLNQLGQPGVIDVAGEIARFDMPVPKTRHDDRD